MTTSEAINNALVGGKKSLNPLWGVTTSEALAGFRLSFAAVFYPEVYIGLIRDGKDLYRDRRRYPVLAHFQL